MSSAFALLSTSAAAFSIAPNNAAAHPLRCAAVQMGGPSGLPRMKPAGWKATKSFNPTCEYDERIATLYRDLEITLGTEDRPNEAAAMQAIKRWPNLINPAESSRWVFFRSKDLLIQKLGSENAAIQLLAKDPTLMLHPKYDGLNPKLEAMLSPEDMRAVKASGVGGAPTPVVLGVVGVAALGALVATGSIGGS